MLVQHALSGQWNTPKLLEHIAAVSNGDASLEDFEIPYIDPGHWAAGSESERP